MTKTERQRVLVIGKVDRGELTAAQAAEVLQRSVRQVQGILWRVGPPLDRTGPGMKPVIVRYRMAVLAVSSGAP